MIVDRHALRRIAALPRVIVDAVADLVLGHAGEPRHDRLGIAHLIETIQRLDQHRLQDVSRFQLGA